MNLKLFLCPLFVTMFFALSAWSQDVKSDPKTSDQVKTEAMKPAPETTLETTPVSGTQENTHESLKKNNPDKNNSDKYEKLEVTGSRIKRIHVEGASPILTLDRDYLNRTGFNNIGDVLRDTTVATYGGQREASLIGGAGTGASTTSLRGFGSSRILVLMDGKRLPNIGGSTIVDLSLIPMAAVERVEILKDGASAIYGSDALGGVINIITKKNYDGASFNLGYTLVENAGGNRTDIKASYGKNFRKANVLGVLQVRSNEGINSRDYYYSRLKPDDFSPRGSPGSWKAGGVWHPGSPNEACPRDQWQDLGTDKAGRHRGSLCGFDYSRFTQTIPDIDQYNALVSGSYDIDENLSVFARGIYTRRDVRSVLAPPPDRFHDATGTGGLDTRISGGTARAWGLPASGVLEEVGYRLVEEAGHRISEVKTNSFSFQTGVSGAFFDSWEWEFSGVYGASDTTHEGISGYANKQVLFDAARANPASFNPFSPSGSKSNLGNIPGAFYKPLNTIESSVATINLVTTGELPLSFGGRALALAAGASTAWQTYGQTTDPITTSGAQWAGGTVSAGRGDREIQSAYMELSAPFLKTLEMQAAGRFDNFSDFGSTLNPKLALRYQPLNLLLLRASWGTGYRAPSLEELYEGQSVDYPYGQDPVTGQATQFERISGGNSNLSEETSHSLNVGAVIDLGAGFGFLEGLDFTMDYWMTTVENEVTLPNLRDIFAAEQQYDNSYLQTFGLSVNRNDDGSIDTIKSPNVNLSKSNVRGMDFRLSYFMPRPLFSDFRLRAIVDQSLLFSLLVEPFPGLRREDRAGFASAPYWKNNVTLGLSNQTYDFSAVLRSIGKSNADAVSANPGPEGKTRDHTELDLRVQYKAPWSGTFSFLVRNVFNTRRPLLKTRRPSSGYLDINLYDPYGRAFGLNYTHNF